MRECGCEVVLEISKVTVGNGTIHPTLVSISVGEHYVVEHDDTRTQGGMLVDSLIGHFGGKQCYGKIGIDLTHKIYVVEWSDYTYRSGNIAFDGMEYVIEETVEEVGMCMVCCYVETDVVFCRRDKAVEFGSCRHSDGFSIRLRMNHPGIEHDSFVLFVPTAVDCCPTHRTTFEDEVINIEVGMEERIVGHDVVKDYGA